MYSVHVMDVDTIMAVSPVAVCLLLFCRDAHTYTQNQVTNAYICATIPSLLHYFWLINTSYPTTTMHMWVSNCTILCSCNLIKIQSGYSWSIVMWKILCHNPSIMNVMWNQSLISRKPVNYFFCQTGSKLNLVIILINSSGCIHSLDWTTGLTYFWFLHILWLA